MRTQQISESFPRLSVNARASHRSCGKGGVSSLTTPTSPGDRFKISPRGPIMLTRRKLLKATAAGLPLAVGAVSVGQRGANAQSAPKPFVLAHGSWHGGWCWKRIADQLRSKGHFVFAPSYTGMGERKHLLNRDITIETFVEDLVQVIDSEELNNVVLVGHSFAGIPITGVADRVPDRIAHLLY